MFGSRFTYKFVHIYLHTNCNSGLCTVLLQVPDVGPLSYVVLRAEFGGAATTWHLARMSVTNLTSSVTTVLNYGSYLNSEWSTTAYLWPMVGY